MHCNHVNGTFKMLILCMGHEYLKLKWFLRNVQTIWVHFCLIMCKLICAYTPHTLNYPSLIPTAPQTHIHTHTRTHIHMYIHIHTCTHTHTRRCTYTRTHKHTHMCVCAVWNVRACISVISYRQMAIDRNVFNFSYMYIYTHIIISDHSVLCTYFVAYFY